MIRYRYQMQAHPPAPFVNVTLRNPQTSIELHDVPAQLDTAADRTLLPDQLVQDLSLPQIRTLIITSVGGLTQPMPTYAVQVSIHSLPVQTVEVVANSAEQWVLLGRDVLNAHRIVLDGPHLSLEIG